MPVKLNGSSSGYTEITAAAVAGNNTLTLPTTSGGTLVATDASGNTNITNLAASGNISAAGTMYMSSSFLRNRIINGAMQIDQRNAGASGTSGGYTVDRFNYAATQSAKGTWQQNAGAVTPPTGFKNYLGFTSSSSYSVLAGDFFFFRQAIEGFNIADLGWGSASAQSVTLSFWVRSSLTGTFGGSISNDDFNRAYPFTYTISSANTWEQKTITIPGDTTGTWNATNLNGMRVTWSLGTGTTYSGTAGAWASSGLLSATGAVSVVGTNGATFYITGVQLEAGSVATPFERRLYGQELALCQRYYYKLTGINNSTFGIGQAANSTVGVVYNEFRVTMRTTPSAVEQTGTASNYKMQNAATNFVTCTTVPTYYIATPNGAVTLFTSTSLSGVAGNATAGITDGTGYLAWSAEL